VNQAVVDIAVADIGVTEWPPGSNQVKFNDWFPSAGPWCGAAVSFWRAMSGYPLPAINGANGFTYCPSGQRYAYRAAQRYAFATGQAVPVEQGEPGDTLIYSWHPFALYGADGAWITSGEYGGQEAGDHTGILVAVNGDGTVTAVEGNAQPLSALVATPTGWIRMGDLRTGVRIISPSGYPSIVTGTFPQGRKAVYRVALADGSSCEATADHLWSVRTVKASKGLGLCYGEAAVRRTAELQTAMAAGARFAVPFAKPVEYDGADLLPLDPYVVGALIGDGGLTGGCISLTAAEEHIRNRVRDLLPPADVLEHEDRDTWRINRGDDPWGVDRAAEIAAALAARGPQPVERPPWRDTETGRECSACEQVKPLNAFHHYAAYLSRTCIVCKRAQNLARARRKADATVVVPTSTRRTGRVDPRVRYRSALPSRRTSATRHALAELGLLGHGAPTKFVPDVYLRASVKDRIALLQGLMDTDGTIDALGRMEFTSCSEQLARDVLGLIRSLGGRAGFNHKATVTYTSPTQRTRKAARPAWRVQNITFPPDSPVVPFTLPRKVERLPERRRRFRHWTIARVEPVREDECQCIAVSDPAQLYMTDGFIPTHNTSVSGSQDNGGAVLLRRRPMSQVCCCWRHPEDETAGTGGVGTTEEDDGIVGEALEILKDIKRYLGDNDRMMAGAERRFDGFWQDAVGLMRRETRQVRIVTERDHGQQFALDGALAIGPLSSHDVLVYNHLGLAEPPEPNDTQVSEGDLGGMIRVPRGFVFRDDEMADGLSGLASGFARWAPALAAKLDEIASAPDEPTGPTEPTEPGQPSFADRLAKLESDVAGIHTLLNQLLGGTQPPANPT
jgi:hypothetical protein